MAEFCLTPSGRYVVGVYGAPYKMRIVPTQASADQPVELNPDLNADMTDHLAGRLIRRMSVADILQPCVSHDGRTLLVADFDKRITVWDLSTQKELRQYGPSPKAALSEAFLQAAFSADDRLLAVARDDSVVVYNSADDSVLATFNNAAAPITWLPDRPRLLMQRRSDHKLVAVDAGAWTMHQPFDLDLHDAVSLRVDPTGRRLGVHTQRGVSVWSLPDGRPVNTFNRRMSCFNFDRTGDRVVTAGQSVIIWDTDTGTELLAISEPRLLNPWWIRFCNRGRVLAAGADSGRVCTWSAIPNRELHPTPAHNASPSADPSPAAAATFGSR